MRNADEGFAYWYLKYRDGELSQREFEEFLSQINDSALRQEVNALLLSEIENADISALELSSVTALTERVEDQLKQAIFKRAEKSDQSTSAPLPKKGPSRGYAFSAAASLLFAAGLFIFWYSNSRNPAEKLPEADDIHRAANIKPAGTRATMSLSDGRVITLDGSQDGISITDHQIVYEDGSWSEPILNLREGNVDTITLKTPRGGIYTVRLPDGTKVWLNAETVLKYPSRFSEHERVVYLIGEAYFDVRQQHRTKSDAHSTTLIPFKVYSGSQVVNVLGTSFNISAYPDDREIRTTLVEGSVIVDAHKFSEKLRLSPGEQGRVHVDGIYKTKVDVSDYVGWTRGQFVFDNETAGNALRQIARWYDVDLTYEVDQIALSERFSGSISRYDSLATVLDIVREAGGLEFVIVGREVRVERKK